MEITKSRFYDLQEKGKPVKDVNGLKNGQEIVTFTNVFGQKKIRAILNWTNGYLDDGPDCPAVQMEDFHTEYWKMGKLSNSQMTDNGELMPAVISEYGLHKEYWVDGKHIK